MIDIYKKNTFCFLLLVMVFISCNRPTSIGEKKVNNLFYKNKNEIISIVNILNNDSFCLEIRGEPNSMLLNTGNSYNFSLRINNKNKSVDFVNSYLNVNDSLFDLWINNFILINDSINYYSKKYIYQNKINNVKRIFHFIKSNELYSITNYGNNIIKFALEPDVELIFKPKESNLELEIIDGLIFKQLQGEFYYYYNPASHGFF